ncbi:IS66 family insertion sequence element accessory protein TnpB [Mesorhizobium sp.]|uniref:IS66 family insertion sequence element accessory protein TnpB n=1 Tax=Mesorhizobium sp. TaxID=1871066 RepID=UPI0033903326
MASWDARPRSAGSGDVGPGSACRDIYVFRGRSGNLIKIIWHDGLGMSLYAKRLEKGRFLWPSPADGTVSISPAQLAYMLDGIDWRNPRHTFRPQRAG